jgi:hypothetical protein
MKEEEKPHFDRVVGLPEKDRASREEIEKILSQKLKGVGGERIEEFEIDKTERDIEIINFTKDAISDYTRKKYDIPLQNIHVFNLGGVEEFTQKRLENGATSIERGSIVVDRIKSDAAFAKILFHEIIHLNSYTALQLKTGKEPSIGLYRSGIRVQTRNGKKILFKDINEAITELITRRFYQEKIIPSEIFDEEDKKNLLNSRVEEMAKFEALIDGLWEENKDRFKTREDLEDLFFESQFTGSLLKIGRLIEKTFGKGSFRKLGEGNLIEIKK